MGLVVAAALLAGMSGAGAGTTLAASETLPLAGSPDADSAEAPVAARDRLALVFIGYTSAKLCAEAGQAFSAPEISRIEAEVTKASAESGFTQAEQDMLWLDVLNSMASSKGAVSAQSCTEDKAMLRFQMPQVWAGQPAEGAASGL